LLSFFAFGCSFTLCSFTYGGLLRQVLTIDCMFYADFCCGKKKWGKGWKIWMLCGQQIPG
jgi:hypothetical protein